MLSYQLAWILDRSRMRVWRKGRQIGGSTAIAFECVFEAGIRGVDCLICSAAEKNAQEVLSKCRGFVDVARAAGLDLKLTTDARGELGFANGKKILSLAQNPATVRGFTGHLYLDEFSHHPQDHFIYQAGMPVVTRGHRLSVLSTPMGQSGEYYKCWQERPDFSRHDTNILAAVDAGLCVDVELLRRNMDDESFRQEYLCEFIDESSAYYPYDLIRGAIGDCPEDSGARHLGIDVGRKRDLTVLYTVGQLNDMHYTVDVDVLDRQPFDVQRMAIVSKAQRYNVQSIAIDATGIGAQLAEQIQGDIAGVEAVVFNEQNKRDMVIGVKRALEARRLQIPDDPKLIGDIHSIRRTVTAANNVRFDAERTAEGHADRFWALALAMRAASDRSGFRVLFEC